jgi:aquaporin Z
VRARSHWPEYAIETAALAVFMVSAVLFTALVEHPASPVRTAIDNAVLRRMLVGMAMGLTAASIIYSPWGQRSGAHLNPSVTLTFLRLGKVAPRDAVFYVLAHFAGGAAGILLAVALVRGVVADPSVNYVATIPGSFGTAAAFAGELAISFVMMSTILVVSNTRRLARFTGVVAACLIALYITVEAPLSGMSMNPARSFAPALAAGSASSLWIYFLAPPLGMLFAAELYVRRAGRISVRCAKLHHPAGGACHFNCGHGRPA